MQYGFYFNGRRCTGCKTCVLACKDLHDLPSSIAFRQVYEYGGGSWWRQPDSTVTQDTFCYYVSVACNHCGNPACVRVCPTGAMHKDERGLVSVDAARCIGCGYCVKACPYGHPVLIEELNVVHRCDGCIDLRAAGEKPACVAACPMRALDFGPIEELRAAHPDGVNVVSVLPEPTTDPSVVIDARQSALSGEPKQLVL